MLSGCWVAEGQDSEITLVDKSFFIIDTRTY